MKKIVCKFSKLEKDIFFSAIIEKGLNKNIMAAPAITDAKKVNIRDSPSNCLISWNLSAPTTLRIPISFARVSDRAVERFMKFVHAIKSIKIATAEKIYI